MKFHDLCVALISCGLGVPLFAGAQNSQAARAGEPVATVNGQPVFEDDLPSVQEQLQQLRSQEYEIKRKALDGAIEQKLLENAAKKKSMSTDQLLAQDVNSKVPEASDAEVEGYYFALRDKTNRPLSEVKSQLRESLKQAKMQEARQDYVKKLRAEANVVVLLSAPRVNVDYDPARVRGNPKAPVMMVEFSDYQCPYCRQVEPTVKRLLAKYGAKLSLAYRDYPLRANHSQAEIAAEASRCALEQGKFWEYHDQLLGGDKLDKDSLIGYARNVGMDDQQFGSCLSSEKYKAAIDKDLAEGGKAGVDGTPGFFINGIAASGAQQQQAFEQIIDDELSRKH
jgi:protein-disulfide isomerase